MKYNKNNKITSNKKKDRKNKNNINNKNRIKSRKNMYLIALKIQIIAQMIVVIIKIHNKKIQMINKILMCKQMIIVVVAQLSALQKIN